MVLGSTTMELAGRLQSTAAFLHRRIRFLRLRLDSGVAWSRSSGISVSGS